MDGLLGAVRDEHLVGIGRHAEPVEVAGDLDAKPRQTERVVPELAQQGRHVVLQRGRDTRRQDRPGRQAHRW